MKKGLLLAMFLALVPAVSAQFYYGYLSGPIGVLGGFNFANIYSNYAVYIDAIIFLLIFLGLGKLVFGLKEGREREEPGYKLLYIGLALLMTISLLLLESRMGFTLLDTFGQWVSFVLLLILTYAGYAITSEFIKNKWIVFGITLISFLFFLDSFYIYFGVLSFLGEFVKSLFDSGSHRLLYLLAIILLLIGIFRSWKGKETEGEAGALAAEEGPRVAPSAAGPEGPISVEREPPRARELPAEVIATLQEKDRIIAQSQEQMNALAGAIEALNKKIQDASEAGRADLAEKMAAQAREYAERIARIKSRRRDVLRKVAESFNQKLSELKGKVDAQKTEYENLLKELRSAKTSGEEEAARNLAQQASKAQEEIKNRENEAMAVKEEIERIFAEGHAVAGEAEKFDWEKEKEKFGYLESATEKVIRKGVPPISIEPGVMRPKPPLLLPPPRRFERRTPEVIESGQVIELPGPKEEFTEKEIQEALAAEGKEVERIKYHVQELDKVLDFISKRKVFEEKSDTEFAAALLRGKEPKALYLSKEDLETTWKYLLSLSKLFSRYIKIFPKGRYAKYISSFNKIYASDLEDFRKNFEEAFNFDKKKNEVLAVVVDLDKRFAKIGLKTEKELRGKGELFGNLENFVRRDERLDEKEREQLINELGYLRDNIRKYQVILLNFNFKISKLRSQIKALLKLR